MSKTDKTRPYQVKMAEAKAADPYRARREFWHADYDMAIVGCPHSCWMCRGAADDRRRDRRQGKAAVRNWEKEY